MAWAVDQATLIAGTNAAASPNAVATSGVVAAGAKIVVGVMISANTITSCTVSGGSLTWHQDVPATKNGTGFVTQFSATAPAGLSSGTTITLTYAGTSATDSIIAAMSFVGGDGTPGASSTAIPSTAAWTAGTVSTTAGDLVVASATTDAGNLTTTATSPFTLGAGLASSFGGDSLFMIYNLNTAGGNVTPGGTWSSAAASENGCAVYALGSAAPPFLSHRIPLGV